MAGKRAAASTSVPAPTVRAGGRLPSWVPGLLEAASHLALAGSGVALVGWHPYLFAVLGASALALEVARRCAATLTLTPTPTDEK